MAQSISGVLLVLGYTAIFLYLIRKLPFFRTDGISRNSLSGIFLLKITAGLAMWALYTYHYSDRALADIFKFFDDSKVMYDALWERPGDYFRMLFGYQNDNEAFNERYYRVMNNWYREYESNLKNDAHTMIRWNAVVRLFSFGHYNVHTVFICFLSLVGLTAIFKVFRQKVKSRLLVPAVFLLPSVVFWGSGVLKEGLLFFGLGLAVWAYFRSLEGRIKWYELFFAVIGLFLLLYLKIYVLAAMSIGFIAYAWSRNDRGWKAFGKFCVVTAVMIILGLNLHHLFPGYDLLELLALKQKDFIGLATQLNAGSQIIVTPLAPDLWSFIRNMPEALYNTLCLPWFFQANGPLMLFAGMENLLVMLCIAAAFYYRRPWQEVDQPLFWFCLFFILILFLLIGWTTVVSGAIVRYKIPAMPFLLCCLLLVVDTQKLPRPITSVLQRTNE